MKKLLLVAVCFFPTTTGAFFVADDTLVRENQTVLVQSYENKAEITVTQTLKNLSDETQNVSLILPTVSLELPPTFYFNADGVTAELLNRDQAAPMVFNEAKKFNQPFWLGALSLPYENWWSVKNLSFAPNQTVTFKYEYTQPLAFFEDFYIGSVWLADGRATQNLKASLVRAGNPNFWWANQGDWVEEKTPEAWALQWNTEAIVLTENLSFFASDTLAPTLSYRYLNQSYVAEFQPLSETDLSRVVLVLDRSGSVYGVRFKRLQAALKTMLEIMPETTQIKLALVSDEIDWYSENWQANSRDFQREVLSQIDGAQAQGKTDWEAIISGLNLTANSYDERYGLIWFGDFSDLPTPLLNRLANAGWRLLMVDFWQSQSSFLTSWWQRYNSQYVPLFNSGFDLVEADILAQAWRKLKQQWPADQALNPRAGDWFAPKTLLTLNNQAALGQTPVAQTQADSAQFLPRWWAARKVADYLRQHEGLPLKDFQIQAVLSIAHVFGVTVFDLDGTASPEQLSVILENINTNALWDEILRLEKTVPQNQMARYFEGKPFYKHKAIWQSFDWETYTAREIRPVLQVWSEAHENLFVRYSEVLSRPMSFGNDVRFCRAERCATIASENGRPEVDRTDTLFWTQNDTAHWATAYWEDLVWAGVLGDDLYDPASWSNQVSRGQFLVWLQAFIDPKAEMSVVNPDVFSDLKPDQVGANQAFWFHNQGLFKGYADGTARLTDPLKRIEGLKMLMQVYGLETRDVLGNFDAKMPFTDLVDWTQPWGYEAYLRGLVKGYEDQTFRPFQPLTQAETFKLLIEAHRLLETAE